MILHGPLKVLKLQNNSPNSCVFFTEKWFYIINIFETVYIFWYLYEPRNINTKIEIKADLNMSNKVLLLVIITISAC